MSNTEYLNELVPDVSQGIKDAIMVVRGVDPLAAYSGSKEVELAGADLYMRVLLMPEFSEGSLSIKYKASSLTSAANRIYLKYNDSNYDSGEPTIQRIQL